MTPLDFPALWIALTIQALGAHDTVRMADRKGLAPMVEPAGADVCVLSSRVSSELDGWDPVYIGPVTHELVDGALVPIERAPEPPPMTPAQRQAAKRAEEDAFRREVRGYLDEALREEEHDAIVELHRAQVREHQRAVADLYERMGRHDDAARVRRQAGEAA